MPKYEVLAHEVVMYRKEVEASSYTEARRIVENSGCSNNDEWKRRDFEVVEVRLAP